MEPPSKSRSVSDAEEPLPLPTVNEKLYSLKIPLPSSSRIPLVGSVTVTNEPEEKEDEGVNVMMELPEFDEAHWNDPDPERPLPLTTKVEEFTVEPSMTSSKKTMILEFGSTSAALVVGMVYTTPNGAESKV